MYSKNEIKRSESDDKTIKVKRSQICDMLPHIQEKMEHIIQTDYTLGIDFTKFEKLPELYIIIK